MPFNKRLKVLELILFKPLGYFKSLFKFKSMDNQGSSK